MKSDIKSQDVVKPFFFVFFIYMRSGVRGQGSGPHGIFDLDIDMI